MNVDTPQVKGWFVLPGMKKKRTPPSGYYEHRLPWLNWLPEEARNHFVAMAGEFVGTFLFLFFAFAATQVANATDPNPLSISGAETSRLLYISLAFGFSLAVNAWVFFRISGGLFNPAVTVGMCLVGAVPYLRGSLVIVAQILGAISAAGIVDVLFPGDLLVTTSLGAGTTVVQGLFIEMFLTAELVFAIFMLAAEKHKATFIAPVGIGLALFIAEMCGVFFTGGSLNPARSFGPAVILHTFEHYHWIYWIGPLLGSLMASGFYKFIKMLEYETANPGQDEDEEEHKLDLEKAAQGNGSAGREDYLGRDETVTTILHGDSRHLPSGTLNSIPPPTGGPTQPVAKVPVESTPTTETPPALPSSEPTYLKYRPGGT